MPTVQQIDTKKLLSTQQFFFETILNKFNTSGNAALFYK